MPTNSRASRRVELLFESLVVKQPEALLNGNEVNDTVLKDFKVRRIGFDPESSDEEALGFFTSMPLEDLRKYPVCPDLLLPEELPNLDFRDYDPPADAQADDNGYWDTGLCTEIVAQYFKSYILGGLPRALPPGIFSSAHMRQLNWISAPHPFLLGLAFTATIRAVLTSGLQGQYSSQNHLGTTYIRIPRSYWSRPAKGAMIRCYSASWHQ
ncbi:hypothetical protein BDV38DRAFT_279273 [Aspergillus pseudotamarii]|uniref:Uncharacterized protein n=1 Tax=Aspergillus pseudotamarii TaxID=132259 RepID=A0A5N6T4Y4_ASPPS|nr:uncharacterized protein BDV38DRAFT_279273 [Aspergillus pseudotamarii]KAE8141373.1 hypothetical protein BDV38DRAFT_279273 [Aspergillus pseudotamarii]